MTSKKGAARRRTRTKATQAETLKYQADKAHEDIFGKVEALPSRSSDPEDADAITENSEEYRDNCDRGAWERHGYPSFDDFIRMATCSVWAKDDLRDDSEAKVFVGELEELNSTILKGRGDILATRAVIRLREIYERLETLMDTGSYSEQPAPSQGEAL